MLAFTLDRDSEEPLYMQLKRHFIQQIEDGILVPGDRLPASRDLADQLGVARISVVTAYEELKVEGYISARVGRGTFVTKRELEFPEISSVSALTGAARRQNAALREMMRLAARPGVIDFAQGIPADGFLPVDMIRQALDLVLERDGAAAIAYEEPEGYQPLRAAVAKMVTRLGIQAAADEVLITGGCQQALDLAVQALLNPGDVLLTPNPTYPGILDIARARHIIPIGVPVDGEGMQVEMLENLIIEHRPRMLYLAPTYHNPTGTVMPLHRRRYLLDLAARYHLPILEDGVYEDLTYIGSPPLPLRALDENGLVLYASSFSKVLLPGMRIGYLLAGGRLYRRLARVKQAADVCTPALNQRAIHVSLEDGQLIEHLLKVQQACRVRHEKALHAMSQYLPEATWSEPAGGLYLWVELPPDGPTATELYLHAVRSGVSFAMGPLFYVDGQGAHHMRINMVVHPPEITREGISRLGASWRELTAGYSLPQRHPSTPFM